MFSALVPANLMYVMKIFTELTCAQSLVTNRFITKIYAVRDLLCIYIAMCKSLSLSLWACKWKWQKQSLRSVLGKRCSENMQQIYRRIPTPKCDFNKVALQHFWNHTLAWVYSCKFVAYFQNTFPYKQIWTVVSR